jgi:hypothetical protein
MMNNEGKPLLHIDVHGCTDRRGESGEIQLGVEPFKENFSKTDYLEIVQPFIAEF